MFFGENRENLYNLIIKIEEKKTKRSVETNQVTSNLRYELRFLYTLVSNEKDCVIYKRNCCLIFLFYQNHQDIIMALIHL